MSERCGKHGWAAADKHPCPMCGARELERRNEELIKMVSRAEQKMYEMMLERDAALKANSGLSKPLKLVVAGVVGMSCFLGGFYLLDGWPAVRFAFIELLLFSGLAGSCCYILHQFIKGKQ